MTALNSRYVPLIVVAALAVILAGALFGLAGVRTVLGIILFFILPGLLLLRNSAFDFEERIFFSLFAGLGLFPLLVFVLNRVLPSLRMSIIAALVIIGAAALLLPGISARVRKKPQ